MDKGQDLPRLFPVFHWIHRPPFGPDHHSFEIARQVLKLGPWHFFQESLRQEVLQILEHAGIGLFAQKNFLARTKNTADEIDELWRQTRQIPAGVVDELFETRARRRPGDVAIQQLVSREESKDENTVEKAFAYDVLARRNGFAMKREEEAQQADGKTAPAEPTKTAAVN